MYCWCIGRSAYIAQICVAVSQESNMDCVSVSLESNMDCVAVSQESNMDYVSVSLESNVDCWCIGCSPYIAQTYEYAGTKQCPHLSCSLSTPGDHSLAPFPHLKRPRRYIGIL